MLRSCLIAAAAAAALGGCAPSPGAGPQIAAPPDEASVPFRLGDAHIVPVHEITGHGIVPEAGALAGIQKAALGAPAR